MTILQFIGFDVVAAISPSTTPSTRPPFALHGLIPLVNLGAISVQITGGGTTPDRIGVSGLAEDKTLAGTDPAVLWRQANNQRPILKINGDESRPMDLTGPGFAYYIGFRFRVTRNFGALPPGGANAIVQFFRCTVEGVGRLALEVDNAGSIFISTVDTGTVLPIDTEGYFEVEVKHPGGLAPGVAGRPDVAVRLNGEQIGTSQFTALFTDSQNLGLEFSIYNSAVNTTNRTQRYTVADVYIADATGSAPYNTFLGPQYVKRIQPVETVDPGAWTVSNADVGGSALGAVKKAAPVDSSFLTGSLGTAPVKFKFDSETPNQVNGLMVIGRARSNAGFSQPITTDVEVGGQTVFSGNRAVPPAGSAFGYVTLLQTKASSSTDRTALNNAAGTSASIVLKAVE